MAAYVIDIEKGETTVGTEVTSSSTLDPMNTSLQVTETIYPPGSPDTRRSSITKSSSSTSPLVPTSSRLSGVWQCFKRSFRLGSSSEATVETRERGVIVKEIHDTPKGYPRLAAFLDSDENFMTYRRFGYLQSRLLVEKQNDLQLLEDELDRMDRVNVEDDPNCLMTRMHYGDESMTERVSLLARIEARWVEYSQLLLAAQKMTKLKKPTAGEYRSVKRWVEGVNTVNDEDAEFVLQKEDLITLRPGREYAWLDAAIERLLNVCSGRIVRYLFQSPETKRKTDRSGKENYYTRSRIDKLVIAIITIMILILLVLPVYVLFEMTGNDKNPQSDFDCIGVLLVFTLAFSACISLFTKARRHEILAASAAYCAVLVVFIGNLGQRIPVISSTQG